MYASNSSVQSGRSALHPRAWPLQAKIAFGVILALIVQSVLAVIALAALNSLPAGTQTGIFLRPVSVMLIWIAGFVLIGLFRAIMMNYVVQPLNDMASSLEQIERGNYAVTPLTTNQDTIGELSMRADAIRLQLQQAGSEAQATIERQIQTLSSAIAIGQSLSGGRDAHVVLQNGVEALCSAFRQVHYARIYLPNNTSTEAILTASAGLSSASTYDADLSGHKVISLTDMNPISLVFMNRQGTISRLSSAMPAVPGKNSLDLTISDPTDHYLVPGMRARCLLPLVMNNQVAGVLEMQSSHEEAFVTRDLPLLQSVADQIATALQSAELFEDLQMRLREVELINSRLTGRTWREYTLKRRTTLSNTADVEDVDPVSGGRASEQDSLWMRAIERGEYLERTEGDQIRFAVPIRLSGQILGAVEWVMARESYTTSTRQLAESLTGRLALVADNVRLLEQSQTQTARERLLNNISGKLMQQVDVEQILQTAVQELGQALRVSQAVIRLDDQLTRN